MNCIKSMTGFGRSEIIEGSRRVTVEMKAVNHRYLDVNIKMPKTLNFFDSTIRSLLKDYMQRGKVDIFITYEDSTENNVSVTYHRDVAASYMDFLNQMSKDFGIENDIKVSTLSRYQEVFTLDDVEIDEEGIWKLLEKALREACDSFVRTRINEGENLRTDLNQKLTGMLDIVAFIEQKSPEIIENYKADLKAKVEDMLGNTQIDESRLLTEVTIFADKVCVDEELVRLRSHIETVRNTLNEGGGIGRKLDFLAQEMNREANTILSKSSDLEVTNRGVELKTEIEKVREQIQNIE